MHGERGKIGGLPGNHDDRVMALSLKLMWRRHNREWGTSWSCRRGLELKPDSDAMKKQLESLQADYARVTGKPFKRFYCPIMGKDDEKAELCLGHVINRKLPNSSKKTIVQRKDVDGFYGRLMEPAFVTIMRMQSQSKGQNFYDPEIRKKVGMQVLVDGEPCEYYEDQGHAVPPQYTKRALRSTEFGDLNIVLKKEIDKRVRLTFRLAHDREDRNDRFSPQGRISHALSDSGATDSRSSEGGQEIGYNVIGKFFREHEHDETEDALGRQDDRSSASVRASYSTDCEL